MMENETMKAKLENYYELPEDEQNALLKSILKAANDNPDEFIAYIKSIEFNDDAPLSIIYEALAKDIDNWGKFFLEEFSRLFDLAKNDKDPEKYLIFVNDFAHIKLDDFKERKNLLELAITEIDDNNQKIRYWAYNTIGDFYEKGDIESKSALINGLQDPSWPIRKMVYSDCIDFNILPENFKLSLKDKMRMKFE
jgi:hypothetical protein